MRLAALAENPCDAGYALHPSGAVCIPLGSPAFTEAGVCHTTDGIEVPCPSTTSIDVSADIPDEGIPGWVWAISAGMIGLAVIGKKR